MLCRGRSRARCGFHLHTSSGRGQRTERVFVTPTTTIAQLNGIDVFDPVYGILPPMSPFTSTHEHDKEWGAYCQDQMDLTSKWKLHGGVRYDDFKQSLYDGIANKTSYQTVTAVSPDVGLVYTPVSALSLYASYGKGFRPNTGQDAHGVAFQPEVTKSYEHYATHEIKDIGGLGALVGL